MFPQRRHSGTFSLCVMGILAVLGSGCQTHRSLGDRASAVPAPPGVALIETNGVIRVEVDGQHFTDYRYQDVTRPYFYPILGPGGVHMTRRWPQEEVSGEERDHPHHHGLWWAHGEVNGVDFWSEGVKAGRTVHQGFSQLKSGTDRGVLTTRNEWRAKDGTVVATDERTMRFHRTPVDARLMDFEITVIASHGDLVLGDTKEGSMSIRVPESMRVKQPKDQLGAGHLVSSRGASGAAVWGKRAEWCDYYGPVDGRKVGISMFDHPSNPRHPTWWHARDYGLFAANPFGLHDFEKKPKGEGDLRIPAGKSVTFRYRFLFHGGDTEQGRVAEQWTRYQESP